MPETGVTPSIKVKVDVVIVKGSIAMLKLALITLFRATFVARFNGSVEVTMGIALVVKVQIQLLCKILSCKSLTVALTVPV